MFALVITVLLAQNSALQEGKQLAQGLHFAEAIDVLEMARREVTLVGAERRELLTLLAKCLVAEERRPQAESAYAELLSLKPDLEFDANTPPKLRSLFETVKHRLYPAGFVQLQVLPASPDQLRARLVDPWRLVARLTLHLGHAGSWSEETLTLDDDARATHTFSTEPGTRLSWFLTADSASGAALATEGTEAAPHQYVVASSAPVVVEKKAAEAPSRLSRAPGWIAVATAAAALGTGVALGVASRNDVTASNAATGVGDAQRLHARAQTEGVVATACFIGAGVAGALAVVAFVW